MTIQKECAICGKWIAPERIQMMPQIKTCSPECARMYKRKLQRDVSRRRRQRAKEAKK